MRKRESGVQYLFVPAQNMLTPIESTCPKLCVTTSTGIPFRKLYNVIPELTNPQELKLLAQ
jgi:hypothetical protein